MKAPGYLICLFLLLSVGLAAAENVALGKKATISPSPNYKLCTDPEDAVQLTDGKLSSNSGQFWSQKSTVGWTNADPRIVIDLGRVEPIGGIAVRSVGGGVSGVHFPKEIAIYVSDDNEVFHEAARVMPNGLRQDGRKAYTHFFSAANLRTRGRYVMIHLKRGGNWVFTDEIEVHRGNFDPATIVFRSPAVSGAEMQFGALGLAPETYTRGHFPETPHVAWASPLAGKVPKAILMSDFRYMRDVVEIAQRLGVDYTPAPFDDPLPELVKASIAEKLDNCDVLVVGAINWEKMPPILLKDIRARIREGMGLVCVEAAHKPWRAPIADLFSENPLAGDQGILDLVPVTLIPGYRKPTTGGHFKLSTYGKGRVALLDSATFTRPARYLLPAFGHEDYIEKTNGPLEYWFAAFSKLVLWAAGGRDERLIARVEASPERIVVEVAPSTKAATLRLVVRDPFFNPAATWEKAVSLEGGRFEFQPPEGLEGVHTVDAWLLDRKAAILDFGSSFYKRQGESRIASIKETKPLFAPGEPVEIKVSVQKPTEGLALRAALFDTEGREVAAPCTVPVGPDGSATVSLPYANPLTLSAAIDIELLKGESVLEKQRKRIWVELPDRHDFTVIGWTVKDAEQPVAAANMEVLRKLGVDGYAGLYQPNRAENAALGNLRFAPENIARVAPPKPSRADGIRVPCLNDPSHRTHVDEKLREWAKGSRRYGAIEWSLGDEESLGKPGDEYCFCSHCLTEFREWLKGQYTGLQALNESWESHFAAWADITPAKLKEVKPGGSLAPWLDHRRFMESVFAGYHERASEIIKSQNPAARVGLSGTQNPNSYNGYDWWKLMNAVDHVSGYVGVQSALQRSFMRPGTFWTTFIGYDYGDSDEQKARGQPWKVLFSGANGVNYFALMMSGQACGLLRTDFSPTRKADWFFAEIRELKAGTGRLFMEGVYEDDGIGILYSPASIHAATAAGLVDPGNKRKNYGVNLTNLTKLLSESHYQYRFVHEEQLKGGELSRLNALFLPWCSALSEAESVAIRKFVEDGGTVIADSFTGVRDAHGKPRAMVDDLFGVTQPLTAPSLADASMEVSDEKFSGPRQLSVATGAGGIALKGGEARASLGGAPAFIVHRYGRGMAIFLNASFSNYSEEIPGGEGGEVLEGGDATKSVTAPIRAFVAAMLAEAGVPVPMPVQSAEDAEIELSRFRLGDARLIGAMRTFKGEAIDLNDRADVTIDLGARWCAYDIRAGKFLGETGTIRDSFPRAIAKAYALLPYKVNALTVSGGERFVAGEKGVFQIALSVDGTPGTHVVHVAVTGPDGKERPLYARNLIAPGGAVAAVIPFAWNDQEGEWTITAKDVATGITGSKRLRLGR